MAIVNKADLVASSVKYQRELMLLPFIAFSELGAQNGFFVKKGVYGTEKIVSLDLAGRMRPYHNGGPDTLDMTFVVNELTTYLGEDYTLFEINQLMDTLWGLGTIDFSKLSASEIGKLMLSIKINRNLEAVRKLIWKGVRNAGGTTTTALFNGFDTIIAADIAANKITAGIGNLSTFDAAITADNAVDKFKAAYRALPEELKEGVINMYVNQTLYEMYCDDYEALRGNLHDKKLGQVVLHGSDEKCIIKPQSYRLATAPVIFSIPNNLTIGTGAQGEKEKVMVKEDNNVKFMQMLHLMFFGTTIQCYDPRVFHVYKQFGQ